MQRLFNNKWGILALVLAAVYIVYSNAIEPFISADKNMVEMESPLPEGINNEITLDQGLNISLAVERNKLYWNDHPVRDPFRQAAPAVKVHKQLPRLNKKSEPANKKKSMNRKTATVTRHKPLPVVTGFVSSATSRFAIINGKIVSEGETVNNYRIMRILQNGVRVKSSDSPAPQLLTVTP